MFFVLYQGLASALLRQRGALFAPSPPRFSSLVLPTNSSSSSGSVSANSAAKRSAANPAAAASGGGGGVAVGSGGVIPGGVPGAAAEDYSVTEEGRVAVLRSALARVRLEEDRTARAEVRACLMAISDPSSAMPVSFGLEYIFGFCFPGFIYFPVLILVFDFGFLS